MGTQRCWRPTPCRVPGLQVTGGRNGYGAKLANIFSNEFVVETCDGIRKRRYKQVRLGVRRAALVVAWKAPSCSSAARAWPGPGSLDLTRGSIAGVLS